ncbi:MAG: hypothetical protein HOQ00_08050, partial [Agromyces sp.]|nr:hypothetical protein [Agromyces sp.]
MHRRTARRGTAALAAVAVVAAVLGALTACTAPENGDAVTGIVPAPTSAEYPDAAPFRLDASSRLVASGAGAAAVAELFAEQARRAT